MNLTRLLWNHPWNKIFKKYFWRNYFCDTRLESLNPRFTFYAANWQASAPCFLLLLIGKLLTSPVPQECKYFMLRGWEIFQCISPYGNDCTGVFHPQAGARYGWIMVAPADIGSQNYVKNIVSSYRSFCSTDEAMYTMLVKMECKPFSKLQFKGSPMSPSFLLKFIIPLLAIHIPMDYLHFVRFHIKPVMFTLDQAEASRERCGFTLNNSIIAKCI